ncbi:MAG: tetratricopeptide repeat protein [Kiritimatiellae bacterium]|nr:tetratricopeptide repeat protein [Kiritimatiellia bacterium]MCO5061769.1 tetratricopeptide repeat protein [Kiritimatiellia bacterium]MCO6399746.1 tetratricopeptide repeat protein [Verrucomicrobiota bacterium]
MEEHRDIYTKPTGKPEGPDTLPAPELDPTDLRRHARRRTIWLSSAMGFLLLAAAVYFFFKDPASNPMLDLLRGGTNRAPREVRAPTPLAAPSTTSEEFATSIDQSAAQAPADLPPQKLADAMSALRKANEYLVNREWDLAEAQTRVALDIWPDMNAALRILGAIYLQRGQFDQAILTLEKALKGDPFGSGTFNNLATAYMQRGQLDRAEDLLLGALQVQPDSGVSQINLGLLYILWGRYEQAAEHLQIAVRVMPDNMSARNNLGVSLMRLGRYEEARSHFRYTLSQRANRPEPYFNTAISFVLERNYPEAMAWLRQGVAQCTPVEAQRLLMDSDLESMRVLPEFQALMRELSDPRAMQQRAANP